MGTAPPWDQAGQQLRRRQRWWQWRRQQQQQRAPEWGLYSCSWLASPEYSHFASIHTKKKGLSKFRTLILLISAVLAPPSGIFSGVMSHGGQRSQYALLCTQSLTTPESYSTNAWVHKSHQSQERHRKRTLRCVTVELPAAFSISRGPCSVPSAAWLLSSSCCTHLCSSDHVNSELKTAWSSSCRLFQALSPHVAVHLLVTFCGWLVPMW